MLMSRRSIRIATATLALAAFALAGCGSSGSSKSTSNTPSPTTPSTSSGTTADTVKSGDKPKVEALQSSITDLQTAINNLSGNGISGMTKVATAARNVATSAQALLAALEAGVLQPGGVS